MFVFERAHPREHRRDKKPLSAVTTLYDSFIFVHIPTEKAVNSTPLLISVESRIDTFSLRPLF